MNRQISCQLFREGTKEPRVEPRVALHTMHEYYT